MPAGQRGSKKRTGSRKKSMTPLWRLKVEYARLRGSGREETSTLTTTIRLRESFLDKVLRRLKRAGGRLGAHCLAPPIEGSSHRRETRLRF